VSRPNRNRALVSRQSLSVSYESRGGFLPERGEREGGPVPTKGTSHPYRDGTPDSRSTSLGHDKTHLLSCCNSPMTPPRPPQPREKRSFEEPSVNTPWKELSRLWAQYSTQSERASCKTAYSGCAGNLFREREGDGEVGGSVLAKGARE